MAKSSGEFRFRKHDSIGANAAEDDGNFLDDCFVDTGDLTHLLDPASPYMIVRGRTGSGKTAILSRLLSSSDHAISIEPEALSLNYIGNSILIRCFSDAGVNLEPFYKLLWRHVFAVEIFQHAFDLTDESSQTTWLERLAQRFESTSTRKHKQKIAERRQKALDYLQTYGPKFFQDTEERTKEVVTRFEGQLKERANAKVSASTKAKLTGVLSTEVAGATEIGVDVANALTEEERTTLAKIGKEVVDGVQVRELTEIVSLVDEILDDHQHVYYLVIDRLDESWADDILRFRLIKALVDSVRDFRRVRHAKIIVGVRTDLLDHVFRFAREPGMQEEKYSSLYMPLRWSREDLTKVIDARVQKLVRDRYVRSHEVTLKELMPIGLFPGGARGRSSVDYLIERTWGRPRDLIAFFNCCIARAEGKAKFSKKIVHEAEAEYSRSRLRALEDEWNLLYPHLADFVIGLLRNRELQFDLGEISNKEVGDLCLHFCVKTPRTPGALFELASSVVDERVSEAEFRQHAATILYRVGVVGLKTATFDEFRWSSADGASLSTAEVDDSTRVRVHLALSRVLGVSVH